MTTIITITTITAIKCHQANNTCHLILRRKTKGLLWSKFSEILQQTVAAKDDLWPPSETTSNIRNGLVVGHGAELPPRD